MGEPLLGSEGSRITMQQRTNVSMKLAAYEKGSGEAVSAQSAGQVPAEVGVQDNQTKAATIASSALQDSLRP